MKDVNTQSYAVRFDRRPLDCNRAMIIRTIGEASRLRDGGLLGGMRPTCFRCGEPLTPPIVVWVGHDGDDQHPEASVIAMDPECARAVGADLIHDGNTVLGKEAPKA